MNHNLETREGRALFIAEHDGWELLDNNSIEKISHFETYDKEAYKYISNGSTYYKPRRLLEMLYSSFDGLMAVRAKIHSKEYEEKYYAECYITMYSNIVQINAWHVSKGTSNTKYFENTIYIDSTTTEIDALQRAIVYYYQQVEITQK